MEEAIILKKEIIESYRGKKLKSHEELKKQYKAYVLIKGGDYIPKELLNEIPEGFGVFPLFGLYSGKNDPELKKELVRRRFIKKEE